MESCPCTSWPPIILRGVSDSLSRLEGATVNVPVTETEPKVAVTVTSVLCKAPATVTGTSAYKALFGILSVAGTTTSVELLLDNVTLIAAVDGALRVTRIDGRDPLLTVRDVGNTVSCPLSLKPTDVGTGGMTVKSTLRETPKPVAASETTNGCSCALTETVTGAAVAPAGTVTNAGTVTRELVLASVTTTPPSGAGNTSVTCPVALPAPLCGCMVNVLSTGASTVSAAVALLPPATDAVMIAAIDCVPGVHAS